MFLTLDSNTDALRFNFIVKWIEGIFAAWSASGSADTQYWYQITVYTILCYKPKVK